MTVQESSRLHSQNFVDFMTNTNFLYYNECCGSWLYGVEWDEEKGWLAFEELFDGNGRIKNHSVALLAWRDNSFLPKGYFAFGYGEAMSVYGYGHEKWGVNWHEGCLNYKRVNEILQLYLFGKVKYA